MKTKVRLNKGMTMVLSASLVLCLASTLPGIISKSYAASNTEEPSVQVYADVATLTAPNENNIFTPKYKDDGSLDSDSTKVAKLKFGKVGDKAIEWYILGADDNIDGEKTNIAIFVTSAIGDKQVFYKDVESHAYVGDDDEDYVKGTRSIGDSIHPNHYGESDIRAELRKMAGDEGTDTYHYFNSAEKAMMQKTMVLTRDQREYEYEEERFYTVKDKLYLASGHDDFSWNGDIYVGNMSCGTEIDDSNEYTGKKLKRKSYWNGSGVETWFFLRSPVRDVICDKFGVQTADASRTYFDITGTWCHGAREVRPASNLNLESCIFTSAAEAAKASESGELLSINRGAETAPTVAMTLRLKDVGETAREALGGTIGGVELTDDKIEVTRGTTEKNVTLIVQGKDYTGKDWYYAKTIIKDTTVTAEDIFRADTAMLSANPDLSKCKIWLEATGKDEMIYAVNGSAHKHTYDNTWTAIDDKQHAHLCTDIDNCDDPSGSAKNKESHTYDVDNVCIECEYRQGAHIVTMVEQKEPTRTTVGYKEHFECSHCDMWFIYPATLGLLIDKPKSYFEIPATSGTTYSDGSTRNSDRYKTDSGSSSSRAGSGSTSKVTGASWSQDANGRWWYYNGNTKVIGWVYDRSDGKWYYCDAEKGRLYGWFYDTVDGYWYYLDANTGAMLTGWQLIGGKQYYFASAPQTATYTYDTASAKWVYSNAANLRPYGSMYAGTVTPDNYSVDADGARVQ